MVTDSAEKLEVIVEEGADGLLVYDGMRKENARHFRKTHGFEMMMAIDPDTGLDDSFDTPDTQGAANEDFAATEPDVAEVAHFGNHPSAAEASCRLSPRRLPATGPSPTHCLGSALEPAPSAP